MYSPFLSANTAESKRGYEEQLHLKRQNKTLLCSKADSGMLFAGTIPSPAAKPTNVHIPESLPL